MTGLVRRKIGFRTAGKLLVGAFSLMVVFHILVLTGILPGDIVWGGHEAGSHGNLVMMELVALAVTFLFMFVIAVRTGLIGITAFPSVFNAGSWFVFAYMLLNTFGNLAAVTDVETLIFTPVTIVLAVLSFRVAVGE